MRVLEPQRGDEVRARVAQFARQLKLQKSSPTTAGPNDPPEEKAKRLKTTYYVTGTRSSESGGLTYFDATPECKAIRLYDGSGEWTEASRARLAELRALLEGVEGARVEAANVPEDWERTTRGLDVLCSPVS